MRGSMQAFERSSQQGPPSQGHLRTSRRQQSLRDRAPCCRSEQNNGSCGHPLRQRRRNMGRPLRVPLRRQFLQSDEPKRKERLLPRAEVCNLPPSIKVRIAEIIPPSFKTRTADTDTHPQIHPPPLQRHLPQQPLPRHNHSLRRRHRHRQHRPQQRPRLLRLQGRRHPPHAPPVCGPRPQTHPLQRYCTGLLPYQDGERAD